MSRFALLCVLLCLTGCTSVVAGTPAWNWNASADRCAWVTPELRARLVGGGPMAAGGPACHFTQPDGEDLHITWLDGYYPVDERAWFMRRIDVVGPEAREYAFRGMSEEECVVQVNTRGLTNLHVLSWRPDKQPRVQPACDRARAAANEIARAVVPRAGGKPAANAPTKVPASKVDAVCEVVDGTSASTVGLQDGTAGTSPEGPTCTYSDEDARAVVLVTASPLSTGVERRLGGLPARQDDAGAECVVSVDLGGKHLRVTHTFTERAKPGVACKSAEAVVVLGVANLMHDA